jgi:AcrR family transcriptional regulator
MGITERRERQRAELRDQILSAAARIVAEEGFAALTMRKIADAIEYSPATIYLHFSSRDEIAMQLVRDGFGRLLQHLAPAIEEPDALERLKSIGRRYLDFSQRYPATYRLIFMEDERFAREVIGPLKEAGGADSGAFDLLVATVGALIDDGTFRPMPAELIAGLLAAAVHGIASLGISCPTYPFGGELAGPLEAMLDVLLRGFSAAAS